MSEAKNVTKSQISNNDTINKMPNRIGKESISEKQLNESYKKIIIRTQNKLPISSKLFSKFIHNHQIETVSDLIGNTIARPNAILIGSIFAFVATLSLYIISKTIGYSLSGSETIISFAIGWSLGIISDMLKYLIIGNKASH